MRRARRTEVDASPADAGAQDACDLVARGLQEDEEALAALLKLFHADRSLTYSVQTDKPVRICRAAWLGFERLFQLAREGDNRERPFIIVMDEENRCALDCYICSAGTEGECAMTDEEVLRVRAAAPPHTVLAFGHTHPTWWVNPDTGKCGGEFPRCFGAFPSEVKVDRHHWQVGWDESAPRRRRVMENTVLDPELYRAHGADFCEFQCRRIADYNPDGVGAASLYEFIFSPGLRQLGVFQPMPRTSRCVYVPWFVEHGWQGSSPGTDGLQDCAMRQQTVVDIWDGVVRKQRATAGLRMRLDTKAHAGNRGGPRGKPKKNR